MRKDITKEEEKVILVPNGMKAILITEATYNIFQDYRSWNSSVDEIGKWVDNQIRIHLGR
jgi:hypothetical protein